MEELGVLRSALPAQLIALGSTFAGEMIGFAEMMMVKGRPEILSDANYLLNYMI